MFEYEELLLIYDAILESNIKSIDWEGKIVNASQLADKVRRIAEEMGR